VPRDIEPRLAADLASSQISQGNNRFANEQARVNW
jgi:hypothetical protein